MPYSEPIQSVLRSLDILEQVAKSEGGVTPKDIATRLGVKISTAHNLARTLTLRGYLQKTFHPVRYHLGEAAFELPEHRFGHVLRVEGAKVMRQLVAQLETATVTLIELVGGELMGTIRFAPERPKVLQHPRMRVASGYASASGVLFQALWSEEDRTAYQKHHPFFEYGVLRWKSMDDFACTLGEVRKRGYATLVDEDVGRPRVAAPVFRHGSIVAALGASVLADGRRTCEEECNRMISLVVPAAKRLTEAIAGHYQG